MQMTPGWHTPADLGVLSTTCSIVRQTIYMSQMCVTMPSNQSNALMVKVNRMCSYMGRVAKQQLQSIHVFVNIGSGWLEEIENISGYIGTHPKGNTDETQRNTVAAQIRNSPRRTCKVGPELWIPRTEDMLGGG